MGPGRGFYILRPHTAAFSKQSTIIRSDKRANTEHSRVKIKQPPPHHHHHPPFPSLPVFVQSLLIPHPPVAVSPPSFSHFPWFLRQRSSSLRAHRQHGEGGGGGVTVNTRNDRSLPAFLGKRPIRPRRRAVYYLLIKQHTKKGCFKRSYGTWIPHLRCVSSGRGFFGEFPRANEQRDSSF